MTHSALALEACMEATDEKALFDSLGRGDREAAGRLMESTYRQTYAALFKLSGGQAELAADLTQDTYRKAWKSIHSFHRRSRFSTWLYRIAYNTYLNHLRRPRLVDSVAEPPEIPAPDADASEQLEQSQDAQRLRRAVSRLPDPLRFTLTARFWGDLPVAEIARQEGVTGAAIRKRIQQAYGRLRQILEEDIS